MFASCTCGMSDGRSTRISIFARLPSSFCAAFSVLLIPLDAFVEDGTVDDSGPRRVETVSRDAQCGLANLVGDARGYVR